MQYMERTAFQVLGHEISFSSRKYVSQPKQAPYNPPRQKLQQ
ncbi:hypothetical protein WKE44_25075 [Klebsiella pneumoniae]|nr:MAG: hypothetical protein [Bacteriophage sp.]